MKIALYGRAFTADLSAEVHSAITLLQEREVAFSIYRPFYDFLHRAYGITIPEADTFDRLPPDGTDCLVSIGGDGTLLGSLQHVRDSGIPVIGINRGRLGFLSAASLDAFPQALDAILEKKYTIENRTLLEVKGAILPATVYPYALNEIGIQRHSPAMIGVHVQLNGEKLPVYWSDGLLVATPTGSTAYSMSVGGPIVMPPSKSFIISPIAPHNLNVRSLVISDDTLLDITVETRDSNAFLTIDNQLIEINSGAQFTVCKAGFTLRIIRLHGSNFFDTMREKLSWGKDNRNMH
ncbi:MAG: NAD kinase [Prevotellaceae bacterium]|jgi:NAD+ kinase|nr:NAD kinase [Prevotellaceae bacterium]